MVPRWFGWLAVAQCAWGVWAVLGKLIPKSLTPWQGQAYSTIGMIPVVIALWFVQRSSARTESSSQPTAWHAWRGPLFALAAGIASCAGNLPFYLVLSQGGKASTVVPLTSLAPLVTIVFAVIGLREAISWPQGIGIGLSLLAIHLFNVPIADDARSTASFWSPWLSAILLSVVLWGTAGFLQKLATNHTTGPRAAFWFHCAFLLIGVAIPATASDNWTLPTEYKTWAILLALGFTLALGNLAILMAFDAGGKASIIAPLAGLYPLITIPLAIGFLHETIGQREWLGIASALTAVVLLSWEKATDHRTLTTP